MDPFTFASIASMGINAVGKLMSGSSSSTIDKMQAQAYGVQADAANSNAEILGTQADIAGMGVDFAASKERTALGKLAEIGRSTLASQRSYFAGNNLDPTFGSPLVVQSVTAGRISTDMELTKAQFEIDKANALSTEASLRGQASASASQALTSLISQKAYLEKGDADMTAGILGAASAFLGGATSMAKGGFGGASNLSSIQVGSQTFPAYT
ncbi:hypothetical protein JQ599_09710 [Bradyrhizobium diazoefficiens]|nr:hypothetical protein [Bradyrhizobium diazoefficiens]MBR0700175.1 hypothetical protein [Bradyrhizobium diazoefficiens]MBR0768510.1 hypothetical protein [Bradyrhizobium diazoefficiens]